MLYIECPIFTFISGKSSNVFLMLFSLTVWKGSFYFCTSVNIGRLSQLVVVIIIVIEVQHNLFEANIDLFRYSATGQRANGKFE